MSQLPHVCPKCKEGGHVGYDYEAALWVCEACGFVLEQETLTYGEPFQGTLVPLPEFGKSSAAYRGALGTFSRSLKRKRHDIIDRELNKLLKPLANMLNLEEPVVQQAQLFLEKAGSQISSTYSRDIAVAAAVYSSIKMNDVPLTLSDLVEHVSTDIHAIGRAYHALMSIAGLVPPPPNYKKLINKAVHIVLVGSDDLSVRGRVGFIEMCQTDAQDVLKWAVVHVERWSHHTSVVVGASVLLAAEMNGVRIGTDHMAHVLHVGHASMARQVHRLKEALLKFAPAVPYCTKINMKNVGLHSKTIIRVSNMMPMADSSGPFLQGHAAVPQPVEHGSSRFEDSVVDEAEDDDSQVDEYIRSEEEVALYEKLYNELHE